MTKLVGLTTSIGSYFVAGAPEFGMSRKVCRNSSSLTMLSLFASMVKLVGRWQADAQSRATRREQAPKSGAPRVRPYLVTIARIFHVLHPHVFARQEKAPSVRFYAFATTGVISAPKLTKAIEVAHFGMFMSCFPAVRILSHC
jgi:hypothetical protein